jgi:hypothetical protein
MKLLADIPHRISAGLCPVNGIRDLIHWRAGRDWSNEFLWGLGQGGGFAYLRFNTADPPRQMYTGIATPRQHRYLAELLGAGFTEHENRAFKSSWPKARAAVDAGTPPVLGPLDMFHLHYHDGIYHRRHIPIHFVLLVGYDDEQAHVLDTGLPDIQSISLTELQEAWNVNAPGLGEKNRFAVLHIPSTLPPDRELIVRSVADQCRTMLHPPVSMLGIPAMKKLAAEIANWPQELGAETAVRCLRQVREYLNSPPDEHGTNLTAGRDRYIGFLEEAQRMARLDFSRAIAALRDSMAAVPKVADAVRRQHLDRAAAGFDRMAERETAAYTELSHVVDLADQQLGAGLRRDVTG